MIEKYTILEIAKHEYDIKNKRKTKKMIKLCDKINKKFEFKFK